MIQVIQTLKGEVLLLNLLHDLLRELPELAQRTHGLPPVQEGNGTFLVSTSSLVHTSHIGVCSKAFPPGPQTPTQDQLPARGDLHAFVDHLAEVQGLVCKLCPAAVQDNFKDGPHQAASRLGKEEAFPLLSTHCPQT